MEEGEDWCMLEDVLPDAVVTEQGCTFMIYMIS
jgi:hypothetical protein